MCEGFLKAAWRTLTVKFHCILVKFSYPLLMDFFFFFAKSSSYVLNLKTAMCMFIVFLTTPRISRSVSESRRMTWCMLRSPSVYSNREQMIDIELVFLLLWLPCLFTKASRPSLLRLVKFWCLMKVMLYGEPVDCLRCRWFCSVSAWNKSAPGIPAFSAALQEAKHIVIVWIFRTVWRTPENKSSGKRRKGKENPVGRSGREDCRSFRME